jgi:putative ABC transport system permease protein
MFLTLIGIAIGIASVMTIMSMGEGAQRLVLNEIEGFGADILSIRPGKEPTGPSDVGETLLTETLVTADVEALERPENVPHLADLAPLVMVAGNASYDGEIYRPIIIGGDAEFFAELLDLYPAEGRLFTEGEVGDQASVAVIGSEVAEELFGGREVVGERITVGGRKFQVVGVFPSRGMGSLFEYDRMVLLPYTTAQTYLQGGNHFQEIIVRVDDPANMAKTVADIEATLRETHGLEPGDEADFNVTTQEAVIDQISTILGTLTTFLTGVVAVALVVGGIGIMNMMLVSVTERTREIGLRKAIGATDGDIILQFMLEALILTVSGGIIGVLMGGVFSWIAALLIERYTDLAWTFVLPLDAVVLGLGVSTAIGLVFGLYPARQAAKRSPIDALRYE